LFAALDATPKFVIQAHQHPAAAVLPPLIGKATPFLLEWRHNRVAG
jgi:hypothetical protein